MAEAELPIQGLREQPSLLRRSIDWLFSERHFHLKVLSGTAAGVTVILILAGVFLWVTMRDHYQDDARTHMIDVIRVSSLVENDIVALQSGYRGFLLTGKPAYVTRFEEGKGSIQRHIQDLMLRMGESRTQRERILKVREIVQNWIDTTAMPGIESRQKSVGDANANSEPVHLGKSGLDQARGILESLENEEQIVLNARMREHEWAVQSTEILNVLPKLERSVIEIEKEKHGYLLTGESRFEEAYEVTVRDFYTYHGHLAVLLAGTPAQAELLANVRANFERWIDMIAGTEMPSTHFSWRTKEEGKARTPPALSNKGDELMGQIRQMIGTLEENELSSYQTHAALTNHRRFVKTSAIACLAFLAVALLVASNSYSFVLVRQQLARLAEMETRTRSKLAEMETRTRSKLAEMETRTRSIIQNILDGMITLDENGMIRSMNPAAEKMFGYREKEMVGYKLSKLVPKWYANEPEAKAAATSWSEMVKRTGTTTLALARTRLLVSFPAEISLSEMMVDEKKFYVAMVRDVTEQKRFEKELAAEKESLAVTVRSIGDGVITTDVRGRIIMMNSQAERLTGWPSKEAIGKPLKTVFNFVVDLATQARIPQTGFRNEAQSILMSLPENATLVARDGSERTVEQLASPICDNKNEVAGVVLVFRDITQRQRAEAERRKTETLEQLGLLAGGIAHDFNNLLTAIIGNISLASLLLPPDDEMAARLVDAKNASVRARDLAQQLLTFARGGAPVKRATSIGKLIQDTISFSLRGSRSRSNFSFGADLWPAEIDPGQISQVIANMAVNADQAMPNGGVLQVSCENFHYTTSTTPQIRDLPPGDYIQIKIKDQGVGIPEQYLDRIFDPYFTTKPKGNGLGLATCYSIVKNHSGLITVESEVHVGTTFDVYLPAALNGELPAEQPTTFTQAMTGSGRVLVVDDEDAIRALVDFTLTRLGYQVAQAATGIEGVNIYSEKLKAGERFDVVILDLTLPGGMGGKEVLKKLIEIDPTVNAIVSSGYATDATMSRYQDFGFRGVISKPYEAAELGKTVHEVIASSHVNYGGHIEGGRLATRVA